jgi:uncharacterized protein YbbK (DUF523 family)
MAVRIAVSACLLGYPTAYDGLPRTSRKILEVLSSKDVELIAFCPEFYLFGTPRKPIEIEGGNGFDFIQGEARLLNNEGDDLTENGLKIAKRLSQMIEILRPDVAYLREKSPFCGVSKIYDGSFSGKLVKGPGIAAAVLIRCGIKVQGVED